MAHEAHDGDDAVVDLESVAEEGNNKEALDADVDTLLGKSWWLFKLLRKISTQNISQFVYSVTLQPNIFWV